MQIKQDTSFSKGDRTVTIAQAIATGGLPSNIILTARSS